MEDIISFGEIINREREAKGISLKELADLISSGEESSITPSYISRLENNNKSNPTINLICQITKKMGLDFKEVIHSFGYGELLSVSNKYENLDTLIRVNKINAPSVMEYGQVFDEVPLTDEEKERLVILIKMIFAFTLSESTEESTYLLQNMLGELMNLRKSRQKTIAL